MPRRARPHNVALGPTYAKSPTAVSSLSFAAALIEAEHRFRRGLRTTSAATKPPVPIKTLSASRAVGWTTHAHRFDGIPIDSIRCLAGPFVLSYGARQQKVHHPASPPSPRHVPGPAIHRRRHPNQGRRLEIRMDATCHQHARCHAASAQQQARRQALRVSRRSTIRLPRNILHA